MENNKKNLLEFLYIYRNDNFEDGEGIRSLSFSVNNVAKLIIKNKLEKEISIKIVFWDTAKNSEIITKFNFFDKNYAILIKYLFLDKKILGKKNKIFNSGLAINEALKKINSDFFIFLVGRTYFNDLSFENLVKYLKNKKIKKVSTFFTINRFFLNYGINTLEDYDYINYYINNFDLESKKNYFYPGLSGGFGAIGSNLSLIKIARGFNENFFWGMNDIELGFRLSNFYHFPENLIKKNIYVFDINKKSNSIRKELLTSGMNLTKSNKWGLSSNNKQFQFLEYSEKNQFEKIFRENNLSFNYIKKFILFIINYFTNFKKFRLIDFFVYLIMCVYRLNKSLIIIDSQIDTNITKVIGSVNKYSSILQISNFLNLNLSIPNTSMFLSSQGFVGLLNFFNKRKLNNLNISILRDKFMFLTSLDLIFIGSKNKNIHKLILNKFSAAKLIVLKKISNINYSKTKKYTIKIGKFIVLSDLNLDNISKRIYFFLYFIYLLNFFLSIKEIFKKIVIK